MIHGRFVSLTQATVLAAAFAAAVLTGGLAHAEDAPAAAAPAAPAPWSLSKAIGLAPVLNNPLGIKAYGWVEQSYTYNALSPHDRENGHGGFDDRSNDYRFNQLDVNFERSLPDGKDFAIGGKVELMYGSDARLIHERGLSDNQTDTVQFDPTQFYLQARLPVGNGLLVKAGKYDTMVGSEVIDAPGNALYSHSFIFSFAEPLTHTGIQFDYALNDNISVYYGLTFGWDVFNDNNNALSHMFGVYGNAMDKKLTYSFNVITGPEQEDRTGNYRTLFDTVLTYAWTDTFSTTINADFDNEQGDKTASGVGNNFYGIAVYSTWILCDQANATIRGEYFRDETGSRFGGFGDVGVASEVVAVTAGLDLHPIKDFQNLRLRPEVRYDHSMGDNLFDSGHPNKDMVTIGADLIITF